MKRTLFLICLSFGINAILVVLTSTLLTYLMQDLGLSLKSAGLLVSLEAGGNLVMGLLSGPVIGALGRRRSCLLFCLMFAAGFSALLFGRSMTVLAPMIILCGLGWGLCNNVCHLLVTDCAPGSVYILHSSYAFGGFVAPLLVRFIMGIPALSKGPGWKLSVWLVIGLSLLLFLLFLLFPVSDTAKKEEARTLEPTGAETGSLSFFREFSFYTCFFLYFFYGGAEACFNSWLITFLYNTGLMSLSLAQTMLSMLWLLVIFGRLAQIPLGKRFSPQILLLTYSVLMTVCILLLTVCRQGLFAGILVALIGLIMAGMTPANAGNAKAYMSGSGTASGIIFSGSGLGAMVLPFLLGLLFENKGLRFGMLVLGIVTAAFSLTAFINYMEKRHRLV